MLNKEETLLFLQDHSNLFLNCNLDSQDSIIHDFNTLSLNDIRDSNPDCHGLVNSLHNLNLKETIPDSCTRQVPELVRAGVKRNCDFLFINYPKWKRIEYQSCKKYDIEEIEFNSYNHDDEEEL
jgi:hypothetical protein